MVRNKYKRQMASILAGILIVSTNINPVGIIMQAASGTELFKDISTIGDNIQYVLEHGDPYNVKQSYADEYTHEVTVNIDTGGIIDAINNANSNIDSAIGESEDAIRENISNNTINIVNGISNGSAIVADTVGSWGEKIYGTQCAINQTIKTESGNLQNKIAECTKQIMTNDDKNTSLIIQSIENMQHAYKVGYLYSVNNNNDSVLWKPTLAELPDISALAYATTGYAAVYSGFWDAGVDNKNVKNIAMATFGKNQSSTTATKSMRALNILGYDALVRGEGYTGTGTKGNYVQVLIPENQVSWGDAVQVLYKSLGQYIYSYSYHTASANITPENSPLSQSLSNITQFDASEGEYHLFVSRSDRLIGSDLTKTDAVYWTKAINDSLVNKDDYSSPISWSDFIILAAKMCELYGIETYSETEANQLLQVYGLEYPIQQGVELADAWTYLKIRGILNVSDISYSSPVSRENLLNVGMCIADEASRTDYKQIQIVQSIDSSLVKAGYYPAKNVNYTADALNVKQEFDYNKCTVYDYFIAVTDEKLATITVGNKQVDVSTEFKALDGTKSFRLECVDDNGTKIQGSSVGYNTVINSDKYYRIRVPKSYSGNITLQPVGSKDVFPNKIIIDSSVASGGVYSKFTIDPADPTKLLCTTKIPFDSMKGEVWVKYTDAERCSAKKDTTQVALRSDATVFEYLAYTWEKWTTPMEVMALEVSNSSEDTTKTIITIEGAADGITDLVGNGSYSDITLGLSGFMNRFAISMQLPAFKNLYESTKWKVDFATEKTANPTTEELWSLSDAVYDLYGLISNDSTVIVKYYQKPEEHYMNLLGNASLKTGGHNNLVFNCYKEYKSSEYYRKAYIAMLAGYGCSVANTYDFKEGNVAGFVDKSNYTFNDATYSKDPSTFLGAGTVTLSNPTSQQQKNYVAALNIFRNTVNEMYTLYHACKQKSATTDDYILFGVINPEATGDWNYNNGTQSYTIMGDTESIKDILGKASTRCSTELLTEATDSSATAGDTTTSSMLNMSVANSTIMSKDGSFLLSWDDLVNSGYVFNTFGKTNGVNNQPIPDENGVYHIYTRNGVVLVSETAKFILVGTTYYNMADSAGKGPVLVWYSDEENTTYFDYRVIMGINCYNYTITGTKVDIEGSSIGTGESVVMTLNSSGQTNSLMETADVMTYNYPDMPGSGSNSTYSMSVITKTTYDGQEYQDKDASLNFIYWDDVAKASMVRVPLASFAPTANWVTVIKKYGDTSGKPEAGLFTYYPRDAFTDSGEAYMGRQSKDSFLLDIGTATKYGTESIDAVIESLRSNQSATDKAFDYEANWYDRMTAEALCNLYRLTYGAYVSSKDWSIRYFNLTDNSAAFGVNQLGENVNRYGNQPGSVYWLEGIGFVVNVPAAKDFDFKKYLKGELMVPLCYASSISGYQSQGLISVNPDVYKNLAGTTTYNVNPDSGNAYGYCIGNGGIYNAFAIQSNSGCVNSSYNPAYVAPYDLSGSKYAPAGIYNFITPCVNLEYITSSDFSKQLLSSDYVFLGSQRLIYSNQSTGEKLLFYRGIEKGLPFEATSDTMYHRVLINNRYAVYIANSQSLSFTAPDVVNDVEVATAARSDVIDYLEGISFKKLLNEMDSFMSWVIMFVFYVVPIIGLIATTILTGISFLGQNKAFVRIIETIGIDPVKFLTFGKYTVQELNFKNTWVSTVVLWISCALLLNCNIAKIIGWCLEWITYIQKIISHSI